MSNVVNDTQVGFVQGTAVLMANGSLKPIEKIVPGDWVMSFNQNDATSELEPMEVIDTINYITRDVIEVRSGDSAVMVARGQLFLTPSADWHFATDTAYITDVDGNAKSFTVDMLNAGKHKIYDIIVDENHSLVANGFRVHNGTGPGGSGTTGGQKDGISEKSDPPSKSPPSNKDTKNTTGKPSGGNPKASSPGGMDRANGGRGQGGQNNGVSQRGNGQNAQYLKNNNAERSAKKTKGNNRPKADPPPAPEAMAYAALQSLQEIMDYICDIMISSYNTNYFAVRSAALEYMKYADALASDSVARTLASKKISQYDKTTIQNYNLDIVNNHRIIRESWGSVTEIAVHIELVQRACLSVKGYVDRSKGVLGKYVGTGKSVIDYSMPGMPKPGPVNLPVTPSAPQYVQTGPGSWVTTTTSSVGTTTTPALTGGLGAAYYRYRTVRGFLYGYNKASGWQKIGPADQWEGYY